MHERRITTKRTPSTCRSLVAACALSLALAVAGVTAPVATPATNCTPSSSWGTNRADLAAQVVSLINQHRASIGVAPLSVSGSLTAASQWKSLHMAGYGNFAHADPAPPVARSAWQRALDCDYTGSNWGENIAWGYASAAAVVSGWIASPGHRRNLENPSYTSTGVGVGQTANGELYWTQNFGNDAGGAAPPPPPPPPPPPSPAPSPAPNPAPSLTPVAAPGPAPGPTPTAPAPAPTAQQAVATSGSGAAALAVGGTPAQVSRATPGRLNATVAFVDLATGKPVAAGSVRCRADVGGKRLRVLANAFAAKSARCAWRVPGWAKGKKLTGVVAVQIGGRAATRLFIRTVE